MLLLFPESFWHSFRGLEWKWWPPISGPSLKLWAPLLSGPSEKSSHSCLPGLWLHLMFTQPMTEHFCLSARPCLKSPNSACSCGAILCCLSQGRKVGGGLPGSAACWAPAQRVVAWLCSRSQFMAIPNWEPTLGLTLCSQLPHSNTWEVCCPQALPPCPAPIFLWLQGSSGHTVPVRVPPSLLIH